MQGKIVSVVISLGILCFCSAYSMDKKEAMRCLNKAKTHIFLCSGTDGIKGALEGAGDRMANDYYGTIRSQDLSIGAVTVNGGLDYVGENVIWSAVASWEQTGHYYSEKNDLVMNIRCNQSYGVISDDRRLLFKYKEDLEDVFVKIGDNDPWEMKDKPDYLHKEDDRGDVQPLIPNELQEGLDIFNRVLEGALFEWELEAMSIDGFLTMMGECGYKKEYAGCMYRMVPGSGKLRMYNCATFCESFLTRAGLIQERRWWPPRSRKENLSKHIIYKPIVDRPTGSPYIVLCSTESQGTGITMCRPVERRLVNEMTDEEKGKALLSLGVDNAFLREKVIVEEGR